MEWENFNEYLSKHNVIANEYEKLLLHLKEKFSNDMVSYENSKKNFINGVLYHSDNKDVIITGERLIIRKACIDDAEFMDKVERHPDNSPWVANWPLGWRIEKFGDKDFLQVIIEKKGDQPIGFIIFKDMLIKHQQLQLKRIAIIDKGKGYGKEALYLSQDIAFNIFKTQRLYLGTKTENLRAQAIYKATGFTADMPDPCTSFHTNIEDYIKNRLST